MTTYSSDDAKRNKMYKENVARARLQTSFADYSEYLKSLKMMAEIKPFVPIYLDRIAQLTNKSNQFNLTTLRCTRDKIEAMSTRDKYITLYGRLEDKFGDNGVVTVVVGEKRENGILDIILWLMSCRVLKRGMEFAMMDELVKKALDDGIKYIRGYYYPTAKNGMVRNFYAQHGFAKESEDMDGNSKWLLKVKDYIAKNNVIEVKGN